jgi:hypothetical protein
MGLGADAGWWRYSENKRAIVQFFFAVATSGLRRGAGFSNDDGAGVGPISGVVLTVSQLAPAVGRNSYDCPRRSRLSGETLARQDRPVRS